MNLTVAAWLRILGEGLIFLFCLFSVVFALWLVTP